MTAEELARYFRHHAEKQELSQAEISRRSGVHKDEVNKMFNGRPGPGSPSIQKVADVLGLVLSSHYIPVQFRDQTNEGEE